MRAVSQNSSVHREKKGSFVVGVVDLTQPTVPTARGAVDCWPIMETFVRTSYVGSGIPLCCLFFPHNLQLAQTIANECRGAISTPSCIVRARPSILEVGNENDVFRACQEPVCVVFFFNNRRRLSMMMSHAEDQ